MFFLIIYWWKQGFKEKKWGRRRDTTGSRGCMGIRELALTTGSTQLVVSCKSRAFSAASQRCRHGIVGNQMLKLRTLVQFRPGAVLMLQVFKASTVFST